MATYRQIHVKMWASPDFQELSPDGKLIFIYLFSNSHRNEAAIYRITSKTISNETDIPIERVERALAELAPKMILYDPDNHVVWVINALKYQKLSPNGVKAIKKNLEEISHPFVDEFLSYYKDCLEKYKSILEGPSEVLQNTPKDTPGKDKGKDKDKGNDKGNINSLPRSENAPKTQDKNPDVKAFIDYYHDRFLSLFGEKPIIDGGKDGAIVKRLLGTYGFERLKGLLDAFFESQDPFIQKSGYTIGVFKTQINKLLTERGGKSGAYKRSDPRKNEGQDFSAYDRFVGVN